MVDVCNDMDAFVALPFLDKEVIRSIFNELQSTGKELNLDGADRDRLYGANPGENLCF